MKTYEKQKNTITECEATGEPVFVLRGRDVFAGETVLQYGKLCELYGCDRSFLDDLRQVYAVFENWKAQGENHAKIKTPD